MFFIPSHHQTSAYCCPSALRQNDLSSACKYPGHTRRRCLARLRDSRYHSSPPLPESAIALEINTW